MLRCLATFLIVCVICGNRLVAIAREQLDLSADFPAAMPFTAAKRDRLEVHTKLDESGEIVVVVSLKNIATKASPTLAFRKKSTWVTGRCALR